MFMEDPFGGGLVHKSIYKKKIYRYQVPGTYLYGERV